MLIRLAGLGEPSYSCNCNRRVVYLYDDGAMRAPLSLSCGRNSVVECQLPKLDVAGSSPVARSQNTQG